MRTGATLLGAAVLILFAATAHAAPTADEATDVLSERLEKTDLDLDGLLLGGDNPSDEGSESSGSEDNGPLSTATMVLAPIQGVGQSLIDLGLQLLNGFFVGISEGATTFATAASIVASAPEESLAIAAAVGLISLLSLLAAALHRYGALGAIPLFSRIAKEEILENKTRGEIFELIRANPGINVSEIGRRLDVAWGTATHHLQKLRQERLVGIRVVGHQKCYFPNGGTYTPREMDVLSATKSTTARRIAEFLVENGPQAHQNIADTLELSPALVSFHVRKLVDAGILARERQGRRSIYTPLESNLTPTPRLMTYGV